MTIEALIVGGGPVGLTMACELLRHGLRCRIVEVKSEREPWSKASAIQPRTLEVFRHMGIADSVVAMGHRVFGANLTADGKRIARIEIQMPGTPYPFLLGLSQKRTEEALEEHLESLGGKLERGVELIRFEQTESQVTASLTRDGGAESITVPWLLACDGAHSSVRKALELPFEGSTFEQELIHADLHATLPPDADPNEGQLFVSEHGALGMFPLFGENHYRVIVMAPEPELSEPTLDNFREHVARRAPGTGIEIRDPDWMIGFSFHSRVVPRYRVGRVMLAGDAAHIHSPAGGQGMNLGIQDAFNLAWKLALVQRGAARPALLDSYHAERHPVGEMIVDTTDAATRRGLRIVQMRNPIATALRNQLMRLVLSTGLITDRVMEGLGGLNVGYPNSPIVGEYHSSIWSANVTHEADSEQPSVGDWVRFERGPGPGERVPDAIVPGTDDMLLDLMATPQHTLLLFDGASITDTGNDTIASIANDVRARYGEHIDLHVVSPREQPAESLDWNGPYIADPDLELHAHFGARSESLYLIRPDGYVGYRSQPAEPERFTDYLETLFSPPAAAS